MSVRSLALLFMLPLGLAGCRLLAPGMPCDNDDECSVGACVEGFCDVTALRDSGDVEGGAVDGGGVDGGGIDGGPPAADGGAVDGGMVVVDGGLLVDGGSLVDGGEDGGPDEDGGLLEDGGLILDAGAADAGLTDAGIPPPDGGDLDAGPLQDAGPEDAGVALDAGTEVDAGVDGGLGDGGILCAPMSGPLVDGHVARIQVTVDSDLLPAGVVGFPLGIRLNDPALRPRCTAQPANAGWVHDPDGRDIVVYDENFNRLPTEVTAYVPQLGTATVFARVALDAALGLETFWVYFGSPTVTPNAPSDVWPDYAAVWHFEDKGRQELRDSLGTYDGFYEVSPGQEPEVTAGVFGEGTTFPCGIDSGGDPIGSKITVDLFGGGATGLNAPWLEVEAFVRVAAGKGADMRVLQKASTFAPVLDWWIEGGFGMGTYPYSFVVVNSGVALPDLAIMNDFLDEVPSVTEDFRFVGLYTDPDGNAVCVDRGSSALPPFCDTNDAEAIPTGTKWTIAGGRSDDTQPWCGAMDEIRVSTVRHGEAWREAVVLNGRSPTFVTTLPAEMPDD